MQCPSCQSENPDAAEVCFQCRAVLSAVTRGSVIASRYRIVAPLGRGGMGAVYHAHDDVLDEDVALKVLRPEVASTPEMAGRFRSEIKLARKVSHWNVCRIHEYGEEGALQYISMERIAGSTLKERLRSGPLPPAEAFAVAVQIADGLAAIHKVGIVHRDLKSANVMVDAEGTAKVMDFGIAKPVSTGTDAGSTGYVLGSPEYMSPEQARGRRADFKSDLYSLGVVVFEAFTGRVPFRGATPVATLMMHVEAPPPIDDPALTIPPAVLPVLRAALAKDPAERFPDAAAMAAALRAARAAAGYAPAGSSEAAGASRTEVVHTRPLTAVAARRRAVATFAGVVLAIAAVAAILIARQPAVTAVPSPAPVAVPLSPTMAASPAPATTAPIEATTTTTTLVARVASPSSAPRVVMGSTPAPAAEVTPPPTPAVTAPAPAPALVPSPAAPTPEPVREGSLKILAVPWAEVTVDGRVAGMTPLRPLSLAPGSHAILLTHPQYRPYTRKVEIRAGETTTLRLDFTSDGVRR